MDLIAVYDRLTGFAADEAAFEFERRRVLSEALDDVPEERLAAWLELQRELDRSRGSLSAEGFLCELFRRMSENVANIDDLFECIRVRLDAIDPRRPRFHELRREFGA